MFDIKWIRENPEAFDQGLKRRGLKAASQEILSLDEALRADQTTLQELQNERNSIAKKIGAAKAQGGNADEFLSRGNELKALISEQEEHVRTQGEALHARLVSYPNTPAEEVPDGAAEEDNVCLRTHGTPKSFDFAPKRHFDLGEALGLMDFERASKMSGSRFVVLKGALALLERALAEFMLDVHTQEFGYEEISPPILVRDEAVFGTGQLPKFHEDFFKTTDGRWLIPTAEVSLTNLVMDEIVEETRLPLRFVAHSPCFRSEAGAAGKDTRGMIRQHQFKKVELVSIAHPETSKEEHERMTSAAEEILKRLELPYRVMLLCAGDMGISVRKTYDLEVWLPGEDAYREISSCSNCGDYQARRMKARFRPDAQGAKPAFVHTLNGSGLAVGRTLIAVLENYQQADGSVAVPAALAPYMKGLSEISLTRQARQV